MSKAYRNKFKNIAPNSDILTETPKSKNYRKELENFIDCESIKVEASDFKIEKETDSNGGEYNKIVIRNASIVESKPKVNTDLPVIVEHLWLLVDNGFSLEENTQKLIINATVTEYIHKDHKNLGINATTIRCSNNPEIREIPEPPVVIPEEFKDLTFDDIDREIICAIALEKVSLTEEIKKSLSNNSAIFAPKMPYEFIKEIGGHANYLNKYSILDNKIKTLSQLDIIINFYTNNPSETFDINNIDKETKQKLLDLPVYILSDHNWYDSYVKTSRYDYQDKGYYSDLSKERSYKCLINILKEINGKRYNYKTSDNFFKDIEYDNYINNEDARDFDGASELQYDRCTLKWFQENDYIGFIECTSGEYQAALREYEAKLEEYQKDITRYEEKKRNYEKMLEDNGLDVEDLGEFKLKAPKEPKKPTNKDTSQIQIKLTVKAKNLIRWFEDCLKDE